MNDGDLISREALLKEFEWLLSVVNECSKGETRETIQRIKKAPAIEPPRWIPASEPPKESGEYIVMIRGGAIATTLLYNGMGGWFEEVDGYPEYYHVTHWMPIPDPPKED